MSKNAQGRKSGVGGAWSSGSSKARGVSGCGQQYTHWELCCSRDSSRSVVVGGGGSGRARGMSGCARHCRDP